MVCSDLWLMCSWCVVVFFFVYKQKTAYEMRISDWSSDVCSSDLIVALAGLKETTTGDTLCATSAPIILERMEFPDPVIEVAVEPKTKADQEKMGIALNRLAAEDPSFRVATDHESGQTIIKGMGEQIGRAHV